LHEFGHLIGFQHRTAGMQVKWKLSTMLAIVCRSRIKTELDLCVIHTASLYNKYTFLINKKIIINCNTKFSLNAWQNTLTLFFFCSDCKLFGLPWTASQYCFGKVIPVWSFPAFFLCMCSSISVRHWVLTSLGWQRGETLRLFTIYFESKTKHTRK